MKIEEIYNYIKQEVIKKGFREEIEWCENIPSLEKLDKTYFFQEYTWVVINSGMKYKIAKKIFEDFWNKGNFNFEVVKHPQKHKAIKKIYNRLDLHFHHLKQSKNKLYYIKSLPFIGDITKYHLARNLGLDYAKPDRHLVRIASLFGYNNVQIFCNEISKLSNDKIGVIDLIIWRFAILFDNYLEQLQNLKNKK